MNRVCIIGRVTLKPELRYTQSNIAFTRMTVAVNRGYGEKQETDFINVVLWRKQAENVCNYLDKGSLVSVDGRIQTTKYKDKDGNTRNIFEVVAETVQFLENKKTQKNEPQKIDLYNTRKDGIESDPFADFGEQAEIYDFLD